MTTNLSKKPVRADLLSARRMLQGRIEYHMKTGDPFAVNYAKAALWAVNYVLKHQIDNEVDIGK